MAANMYRVGDYVYFETSATAPYQIRRIEELTKTSTGNVEAKVKCFYRRRDMSNTLLSQVDKHLSLDDDTSSPAAAGSAASPADDAGAPADSSSGGGGGGITESQRHQLKHRELFLSRQSETLPATAIRGKCSVALYNEAEALVAYLSREDAFYYALVYDGAQKTLLADRGEIRVGAKFQAEIQPLLANKAEDGRDPAQLEELLWRPDHGLDPADVDKFLLVSRSVGTLARAVDACSAIRQPGLAPAAASASRDVTQVFAHCVLHSAGYDLGRAFCRLVTDAGPVLCRDQLEDWSAGECALFEEAVDRYGKDFREARRDHLPWKSMQAIVEYYYMWKTTDRCVQRKRLKATEAERKLKQVYIPSYTKPNPAVLHSSNGKADERCCEGCRGSVSGPGPADQWYAWGPPHLACRLCAPCWAYWKRYGGLRNPAGRTSVPDSKAASPAAASANGGGPTRVHRCPVSGCGREYRLRPQLVRHLAAAHGLDEKHLQQQQLHSASNGSANGAAARPVKGMLMQPNVTVRLVRLLCPELLRLRRLARRPFHAGTAAGQEAALRELPARLRAAGRPAQQPRRVRPRLGPAELDGYLRRACPGLDTAVRPEILSRSEQAARDPARGFPAADAARRAEFFRRLDEEAAPRAAAAAAAEQQQLRKRRASSGGASSVAADDEGGTAAKVARPAQNGGGGPAPDALKSGAAAAADEIFLCGTRGFRAHLTAAQVRRAGRCPFRPVAASAATAMKQQAPSQPPAIVASAPMSNGAPPALKA